MSPIELKDTKDKIIHEATLLFAELGYEGTSIREIAQKAEVNIAAINYHFNSKENLYSEIIKKCYLDSSENIKSIFQNNFSNTSQLAVDIYRHFQNHSTELVATFKMLISNRNQAHNFSEGTEDEMIGPPGGHVLASAIERELNKKINQEDLIWAVRTIFTHIIHQSLMQTCCVSKLPRVPFHSPQDVEKGLKRLVSLVLEDLKRP